MNLVLSATNALLSAIIAPPCAVCGRVLEHPLNGAVCAPCWAAIVPNGSAFSVDTISHARAIGAYEGVLRDVLHAFKYEGRRSVATPLSRMMADHGADVLDGADFIVPVPLHRGRQRERGFNQAEDLACGLGLPVLRALRRARATSPQVGLSGTDRRRNVEDAFCLPRPGSVAGAIIVLVDDVSTTGATLEACARVLKTAGAADVRALTAARVVNALR